MVRADVLLADTRAGEGLARDRERREHADPGADRLGQDARRVPLCHRSSHARTRCRASRALRLAVEGIELRRRAEPARAARRAPVGAQRRGANRRHAAERARGDAALGAGHPDHDARVALSDADLAGAGASADDRHRDPRRGARRRGDEARCASCDLARAARTARAGLVPAHRPFRDAASARGDRAFRLGRPRDRARRRGCGEAARPRGRRSARGHARARVDRTAAASCAGRRSGDGRRHRARVELDLAVDLSGGARARA